MFLQTDISRGSWRFFAYLRPRLVCLFNLHLSQLGVWFEGDPYGTPLMLKEKAAKIPCPPFPNPGKPADFPRRVRVIN